MREIKFRAWINALNCWADEIIISQVGDVWGYIAIKNDNKYFNAGLEQFTGLRDKNWKEIYEGDIVSQFIGKSYSTGPSSVEFIITEYHCGYYIRGLELGSERCESCEVIGNIHENQEILK